MEHIDILSLYEYLVEFIYSKGIEYFILIILGAFLKVLISTVYNTFSTQKINLEIAKSRKLKHVLQKLENTRTNQNADRILILGLHNGQKWISSNHIYKLSLIQELSLENPFSRIKAKVFDKQLSDTLVNHLEPLLSRVENNDIDIIPVKELIEQNFIYSKQLKLDDISYILISKITYNNTILGYYLILFEYPNIPNYSKEQIKILKEISYQIGDILK